MSRAHWENCIAHFGEAVEAFATEYFEDPKRKCLLVAAAGFDPRSRRIAELLAPRLGVRLSALFIREERGRPDPRLVQAAQENENVLCALIPAHEVVRLEVFGDDDAPVGPSRVAKALRDLSIDDDITDIVLDMTALSIGIGFPAARLLLQACEEASGRAFHVMIASNPDLDDRIAGEPGGRAMAVKGFAGEDNSGSALEVARIWVPQLAPGKTAALDEIGRSVGQCYKICPMLPFPARDPRRGDALLTEHRTALVDDWQVDPRDLVYVSERNPLDCYRTLSTLAERHRRAVADIFAPSIVVSPIGSKVVAAGAMMAAIEHDLTIQYIETVRYDFDASVSAHEEEADNNDLVHLLLSGPAYGDYLRAAGGETSEPARATEGV